MDLNFIPDHISALCRQEAHYKCEDYLSPEFQRARQGSLAQDIIDISSSIGSSDSSNSPGRINEFWREKICEWEYQVIDHFDFNREVVAVSLSYLDRFLCTRAVSKKVFQLAAMTCLYMAIKLYEPTPLNVAAFIELSRGFFMVDHVIAMEETILRLVHWLELDLSYFLDQPSKLR